MEFSVFGFKFNVLNAIIFLVMGFLVATLTVCSCLKKPVKETMTNLANAAGLDEVVGQDVNNSWSNKALGYAGNMGYETLLQRRDGYEGTAVPLENTLSFFKDNEFSEECCPSSYSSSGGCACMSVDQMNYLNERAGNRTTSSNF